MQSQKARLFEAIDHKKDELIDLCSELVKIPSDNPPGNTGKLASFIESYFEERGLNVNPYEPVEGIVNIVSSIGEGNPHIIINGHLDQFPGTTGEKWTYSPYSGLIKDQRIHGRGSGDMKGGLASLIFCYTLLSDKGLKGRMTFVGTSDEETGGLWGAKWLLDHIKEVSGDAVLNGEPSGLTIRIGEKSRVPLILRARGKSAHGSFAGYVGENAIMKMVRVLPRVEEIHGLSPVLSVEEDSLTSETMKGYMEQYGHESSTMAEVLKKVTVNIGTIKGGVKDNIVPSECIVELDIRLPLGVLPIEIKRKVEDVVHELEPSISVEWNRDPSIITESTFTDPNERIVKN
jgi:succinyl-diaminopimelate desuccinylase